MECPGALVGIFPRDGAAERYALGVADLDSKAPMTLDMHMRIASVTKMFLAAVVLQLVDEGKLALDDPIAKYVEGVPAGDRITLRQLGNNTSGLFNSIENKDFQRAIMAAPEKDWPLGEILDYAFAHDSYAEPGARWRYSNTNAVLLGMAIEKVTGESWAEAIDQRICRPLKLQHTGVPAKRGLLPDPHPSAYRNGYPDKVIGYGDTFYNVSNYSASWTGPAGEMYSTLDDLGRAIRPLVKGELISDAGREELSAWVETGRPNLEYGFCLGKIKGSAGHNGDVPGFNVAARYLDDLDCTVITMTNLSNNKDKTMPAEELADLVIEHLRR
ncbi:MAG: serine hydrolase domain-containing protein [Pirellulales bacterium]